MNTVCLVNIWSDFSVLVHFVTFMHLLNNKKSETNVFDILFILLKPNKPLKLCIYTTLYLELSIPLSNSNELNHTSRIHTYDFIQNFPPLDTHLLVKSCCISDSSNTNPKYWICSILPFPIFTPFIIPFMYTFTTKET